MKSKIKCPSCGHPMVYVISGWECPMHKEKDYPFGWDGL